MTRMRQARDARRRAVKVVLSTRDERILRALARFRIAKTSDLVRVAFPGIRKDTAAARLRRLFDGGFLNVQVPGQAEENVVSLGAKGRSWLTAHGVIAGNVPRGGLDHHLALVRAWSSIVATVHVEPVLALELFRADWEIREHALGTIVVPDALVQLGVKDRAPVRFALEVDLGTESLRTLRVKIAAYEELRTMGHSLFGWREHGLAVALPAAADVRKKGVQRILADTWSGWWVTWQDEAGLRRAIHALADAGRPPLTDSPCSKGREWSVTPCENERPQAEKTGL